MDRKFWKFAAAAALASSVVMTNPAFAQSQQSESASSGQSSPSQSEQRADDDKDWGWLGLLGLIGLAGLRRRRDRELPRNTTATGRGPGVYNR